MFNVHMPRAARPARSPVVLGPRRRLVSLRAGAPNQPGGAEPAPGHASTSGDELPPELQGLAISEDGSLIDTKTGKVINEMGATRFDVSVRALRGELDPPDWVENTERTPGVILSALCPFPSSYLFQVVGRPGASGQPGDQAGGKEAFVGDVTAVIARVTQSQLGEAKVEVKERLGGKYVSVAVDVVVRAPEIVSMVYDELAKDPRVVMKF